MDDLEVTDFVRRINRRSKNVGRNVAKATREVAKDMLAEVVLATPVDTGLARSNWRVGVGGPDLGVRSPYSPGRHLGIDESSNAAAAIAEGEAVINGAPDNQPLFISNSVPYIGILNSGSSKQAPANFIERAFARASARARRTRLLD